MSSTDNVIVVYSTVHVLSFVHPNCLLSDAANNTDRILCLSFRALEVYII
jgi:hypothetical protein